MDKLLLEEIKKMPPEEAIRKLDEFIQKNEATDDIFLIRGQKFWALNKKKDAINDYMKALLINPDNQDAKMLLELANSILDFYNKDLLNP